MNIDDVMPGDHVYVDGRFFHVSAVLGDGDEARLVLHRIPLDDRAPEAPLLADIALLRRLDDDGFAAIVPHRPGDDAAAAVPSAPRPRPPIGESQLV